jgi:hypothetical protein
MGRVNVVVAWTALFFSLAGTGFATPSASAASTSCQRLGDFRFCNTPVPGGERVCTTIYLEGGFSTESCHIKHFPPAPPPRPKPKPASLPRSYYLTRGEAESDVMQHFRRLEYENVQANCQVAHGREQKPGYIYHLWECAIAAYSGANSEPCEAEAFVAGTREAGKFDYQALHGNEACEWGL